MFMVRIDVISVQKPASHLVCHRYVTMLSSGFDCFLSYALSQMVLGLAALVACAQHLSLPDCNTCYRVDPRS